MSNLQIQSQVNNFSSSDELAWRCFSSVQSIQLITGSKYSSTSEYTTEIATDFNEKQLAHLCAEMSYESLTYYWEKEDDKYWDAYL